MSVMTPITGALAGIIGTMKERVSKAITEKETWSYQFGSFPTLVGGYTIVDSMEPDNDSILISFAEGTEGFTHLVYVTFLDENSQDIGEAAIHINVDTLASQVTHPCTCPHPPFNDIMDIATVINAMAIFSLSESIQQEDQERQHQETRQIEERKERMSRFKVITGGQ